MTKHAHAPERHRSFREVEKAILAAVVDLIEQRTEALSGEACGCKDCTAEKTFYSDYTQFCGPAEAEYVGNAMRHVIPEKEFDQWYAEIDGYKLEDFGALIQKALDYDEANEVTEPEREKEEATISLEGFPIPRVTRAQVEALFARADTAFENLHKAGLENTGNTVGPKLLQAGREILLMTADLYDLMPMEVFGGPTGHEGIRLAYQSLLSMGYTSEQIDSVMFGGTPGTGGKGWATQLRTLLEHEPENVPSEADALVSTFARPAGMTA